MPENVIRVIAPAAIPIGDGITLKEHRETPRSSDFTTNGGPRNRERKHGRSQELMEEFPPRTRHLIFG